MTKVMSVDQQFNTINEKLQLLLKQLSRVQKDNEKLREALDSAQKSEAAAQQRIGELQQQVMILKTATGELGEKDKKEFEKKISQYIREIDKCIAFLSA